MHSLSYKQDTYRKYFYTDAVIYQHLCILMTLLLIDERSYLNKQYQLSPCKFVKTKLGVAVSALYRTEFHPLSHHY